MISISTVAAAVATLIMLASFPASNSFHLNTVHKAKTHLKMVKGNQRANIEKRLEDLLDNDWRVFRARLVAKEQEDETFVYEIKTKEDVEEEEKKSKKSSDWADVFSHVIANILPGKQAGIKSLRRENNTNKGTISERKKAKSITRVESWKASLEGLEGVEDPFISQAEIPSFLPTPVFVDKRRWAHSLPGVETGCVLVANENLGGVFHQTVVLVVEESETQGTTGVIINRPLPGDLRHVADMQNTTLDLSLKMAFSKSPVAYGGPVNNDNFSILHCYGEVEGSRKLVPGVFMGGSEALMSEVRNGRLDPEDALFVKGHTAWSVGQLSAEIEKGVWYPAAVCSDFIFRYATTEQEDDSSDLWAEILSCLGNRYLEIARKHAGRGDRRLMP